VEALPLLGILLIGLLNWDWFSRISELGGKSTIGILTALLIWAVLKNNEGFTSRLLSAKIPGFIGWISYALYLWHVPVFRLFQYHSPFSPGFSLIVKFAATFAIAYLSMMLLEKKALAIGRRWSDKIRGKKIISV
jgi:peptidoglycan/LPS O-acetylase OafA/YrhL